MTKYIVKIIPNAKPEHYAMVEATPKEMNYITLGFNALSPSSIFTNPGRKSAEYQVLLQSWDKSLILKEIPLYLTRDEVGSVIIPLFKDRQDLGIFQRRGYEVTGD